MELPHNVHSSKFFKTEMNHLFSENQVSVFLVPDGLSTSSKGMISDWRIKHNIQLETKKERMKIQDISPLKMINSIIRVPTENDLKDLSDKDFKKK